MSILLEALRKSEKDRHKAGSPDIHSGELPDPVSSFPGKSLPVLLVIVAVSAIAWFAWQHYRVSDLNEQLLVAEMSDPSRQAGTQAEKSTDVDSKGPPSDSSIAAAKGAAGQPRTPVEALQQPARGGSKPTTAKVDKAQPGATPYIISTPANPTANVSHKKTASKQPAARNPAAQKSVAGKPAAQKSAAKKPTNQKSTVKKPANGKPAVANKKEFRPEPISYWELPDAVRANIPEIKFSVLVYAGEASDRFVLINGVRLKQGDTPLPGLVVKEIRRDGVVFKYRLYEFLAER